MRFLTKHREFKISKETFCHVSLLLLQALIDFNCELLAELKGSLLHWDNILRHNATNSKGQQLRRSDKMHIY